MQTQVPSLQLILDALKTGRWLPVAAVAGEIMQSADWRQSHPTPGDWTADAAALTGYTSNTFRRQIRVAGFLKQVVPPAQWQALQKQDVSFSSLEVLQRLYEVDQDQAKSLLPKVLESSITFLALRELYQRTQGSNTANQGRKVFANRSQQFELVVEHNIKSQLETFIGPIDDHVQYEIRDNLRGFPYVRPDFVVLGWTRNIHSASQVFVDAIEVKLFGQDDRKQVIARTIEQASLLESFFRQTWFIFPSSSPPIASHEQHIQELCFHLIALEMSSIGVALIPEHASLTDLSDPEIRRLPTPNPSPSRRAMIYQHLQRAR